MLGLPGRVYIFLWAAAWGFIVPLRQANIPLVARLWVLFGLWSLLRLVAVALQDIAPRHN